MLYRRLAARTQAVVSCRRVLTSPSPSNRIDVPQHRSAVKSMTCTAIRPQFPLPRQPPDATHSPLVLGPKFIVVFEGCSRGAVHFARDHFMRNALAYAGKSGRAWWSAFVATAFAQDDAGAAKAAMAPRRRPAPPQGAEARHADGRSGGGVLAYMTFRGPAPGEASLHEPARTAQRRDQAPHRGRRHLPERSRHHPPRRRHPPRAE